MKNNFDLKKFLTENKLTSNSRKLNETTRDKALFTIHEAFQKAGISMNEDIHIVVHGPFGRHSSHDQDHPSGIRSDYGSAKNIADSLEEDRLDAIEQAKEYYADEPGSYEKLAHDSEFVPDYIFGKQPEGSDLFSIYTVPKGYEVVFEFYHGMEDTFVETAILKQLPGEPENKEAIDIDLIVGDALDEKKK